MPIELKIDFVTEKTNKRMNSEEKCGFILDNIQKHRIIVLEGGLKPQEEALLIEKTMRRINHDDFIGVEILNPDPIVQSGLLSKKNRSLTVIAPAKSFQNLSIALV